MQLELFNQNLCRLISYERLVSSDDGSAKAMLQDTIVYRSIYRKYTKEFHSAQIPSTGDRYTSEILSKFIFIDLIKAP